MDFKYQNNDYEKYSEIFTVMYIIDIQYCTRVYTK